MDTNLQRPYQLAEPEHWTLGTGMVYARRTLRLASTRAPSWVEVPAQGEARIALAPGSIDQFGTRARVDRIEISGTANWRVMATGAEQGDVAILDPQPTEITDVVIGEDDILYVAIGGTVRLHDLRGRWPDATVAVPGGAWRLAAAARGGVYVLGARATGSPLGRIIGTPLRPALGEYDPAVFRPHPEEPDPPRYEPLPVVVPPDVTAAGIATSPRGRLALLGWAAHGNAQLFVLGDRTWSPPAELDGASRPYSLSWVDDTQLAVLVATGGTDAFAAVYALGGAARLEPSGDPYPLRRPTADPFLHGVTTPPYYATLDGVARPLVPISWPAFADRGTASAAQPLDGLHTAVVWHRIYLEAAIPAGTSVRVYLGATDRLSTPPTEWFEHRFGDASDAAEDVPRGAWLEESSEVPFHEGLLECAPRPGVAGLFTALVQRASRRVRSLSGRFLWVRLELVGDGRTTPEVAALRVYADRHGYAASYLPMLYREDTFGSDADAPAPATPADYLDRFLGMFESVLTPLEGKIASAWLLTTPTRVPPESIEWLASWLGFVFAADLPLDRRRAMLDNAWALYQRRGTLTGLSLALDIATGGGVTRGELVIVEDFRLRRTFSTILGADLSDPNDPLAPNLDISGNSLVGDTLFLGEEDRRAFLALFVPDLPVGTARQIAADEAAVTALFDRLAHRATVLVHQEVQPPDLGLIRQIIELETPAHVQVRVVTATYRFRVAIASLVGVDTFLAPKPTPGAVILDHSNVGERDLIQRLPSLDPRLGRTS